MLTKTKYLWVKETGTGQTLHIIEDPIKLFKDGMFNDNKDRLYQIGNEMKLSVSLVSVPTVRNEIGVDDTYTVRTRTSAFGGLKGELYNTADDIIEESLRQESLKRDPS
jgi:hypothetical protein